MWDVLQGLGWLVGWLDGLLARGSLAYELTRRLMGLASLACMQPARPAHTAIWAERSSPRGTGTRVDRSSFSMRNIPCGSIPARVSGLRRAFLNPIYLRDVFHDFPHLWGPQGLCTFLAAQGAPNLRLFL